MGDSTRLSGPDLATEGIPVDQISRDIPAAGHVDGKPVVVVDTAEGPRAIGGRCSHYGGPLADGICVDGAIRCPWHHAAFDLTTGDVVGPPALDPIPVYETSEVGGRIFVTGPVERVPARPEPWASVESVVIVGAGAAGAAAAEALRDNGHSGAIHLLGDEIPVDRPNLSKDYLAGTAPEAWVPLRSDEYYAKAGIELISDTRVVAVDRGKRAVSLADGRTLEYDALLLATGAEPRRLPVDGADRSHVRYLRSFEDSRSIVSALSETGRAAVIGAGFIGLEVAASLRQRGIPVTVIAPEEIPLAHLVGDNLGRFVRDLHLQHGVEFVLGGSVASIEERSVTLDDSTRVEADLVVVGIGVSPRTHLAEAAGLEVGNGILVDESLRTSDPHIWAAGDVARYPGPYGHTVRVEHWVHAQWQGRIAARNMLGHSVPFVRPPFFWSQHYDVPINVTGYLDDWDEEVFRGDVSQRDAVVAYRRKGETRALASVYRDRASLEAEAAFERRTPDAIDDMVGAG